MPTKFAGALIDRDNSQSAFSENLCGITVAEGRPI
jgi:hypothetical protein